MEVSGSPFILPPPLGRQDGEGETSGPCLWQMEQSCDSPNLNPITHLRIVLVERLRHFFLQKPLRAASRIAASIPLSNSLCEVT
ncbi:hypothetical protein TNCV_4886371 [Trichonephila clavipes]|uniref:Uncharacterized protein n=1 Tax=Trichonephila clavipes TaxID=2585209 RepID=A0A8X6RI55_TRICX|nr:hypothetical protein TNCV_4886371 [Trichonephila clavipes]